jgi:hypothetical protein
VSIKFYKIAVLILLFSAICFSAKGPLYLNHADQMSGWNKQGIYQLRGNVQLLHDSMIIKAGVAVWRKKSSKVEADKKVSFHFPGRSLRAVRATFEKESDIARLRENCIYQDSTNELTIRGKLMEYFRSEEKVIILEDAELEIHTLDSLKNKDTLLIRAKGFRYMRQENKIYAWGGVTLTGMGIRAAGDSGWVDRKIDEAVLEGSPNASLSNQWLFAKRMRIDFKKGALGSLWATGDAKGFQLPEEGGRAKLVSDTSKWLSQIDGDTLVMWVESKEPKALEAWPGGESKYREKSFPDKINTLVGDSLRLVLSNKTPDSAYSVNNAKSVYYHIDKGTVKGKNELRGDKLLMAFRKGRIHSVKVEGELASGRYLPSAVESEMSSVDTLKNSPPKKIDLNSIQESQSDTLKLLEDTNKKTKRGIFTKRLENVIQNKQATVKPITKKGTEDD